MSDFDQEESVEQLVPKYVSVKEAAVFWAVSQDTIRRIIKDGGLTAYRPYGSVLRLDLDEMEEYMQAHSTRGGACDE